MSKQKTNEEIRNIENKFGLMIFRMGLTHLFDVGHSHMTDESVAETIKEIKAEADIESGSLSVMTPEFQCQIIECAAELSKFSIWDLLKYVQTDIVIDQPNYFAVLEHKGNLTLYRVAAADFHDAEDKISNHLREYGGNYETYTTFSSSDIYQI